MKQPDTKLDYITFLTGHANKRLLLLNCFAAAAYFAVITFGFRPGNHLLFYLLIGGEVFHLFQIFGYCYTVWSPAFKAPFDENFVKPVDIFITICGEPVDIVRNTALAALAMYYPAKVNIYLLNDGYVANKDNWREIELLAVDLGINCITRNKPGGAKAGNINNALQVSDSPLIAIFDADHVPHVDFLQQTMGYFTDPKMGFVQSPQYYKNQHQNFVTETAWRQQTLFFGPIMSGKNRLNSAFMCGTNMVISRPALLEAGGMCEFNIAEDFLTSLFIHSKGWNSIYVPKVLAEGLAPEDFLSYYKQQFRWTRGSLEVIFKYNPFLRRGLKMKQRLQYVISASYYLSGVVVLMDALLPIIYLFTGITAVHTSTMVLASVFLPYIFLNLYTLQKTSNFSYTYPAIAFSLSSFYLQIRAIAAIILGQKTKFAVTSKSEIKGNFLNLAIPQILYTGLAVIGLGLGLLREGLSASLLSNAAWAVLNVALFMPFIIAAAPKRKRRAQKRPAFPDKSQTPVGSQPALEAKDFLIANQTLINQKENEKSFNQSV